MERLKVGPASLPLWLVGLTAMIAQNASFGGGLWLRRSGYGRERDLPDLKVVEASDVGKRGLDAFREFVSGLFKPVKSLLAHAKAPATWSPRSESRGVGWEGG